jgi:peptidoglycan/LPS O-acetylase OafA/YrhL
MTSTPDSRAYFVALESLRGIAAIVVVIIHAPWLNPLSKTNFFQNGGLMVDMFFVLSGFVISYSYGKRLGNFAEVRRFMLLRLARLYPLHLAFLLVFLGIEFSRYAAQQAGVPMANPPFQVNSFAALLENLLLLHAMGLQPDVTFNAASWSISTEFYAYLLFAMLVTLIGFRRRFIVIAVALIAVSVVQLLNGGQTMLPDTAIPFAFFRCVAGFFLGALTYQIYAHARPPQLGDWYVTITAVMLIALMTSPLTGYWSYAVPVATAALILSLALYPASHIAQMLCVKPLIWLGKVSYSTYMVHSAVLWFLRRVISRAFHLISNEGAETGLIQTRPLLAVAMLALYVALVLLLSQFTYKLIEAPGRDLGKRWLARRSKKTAASGALISGG